jgi:2-polyprenyl-6-methoxyphenol hydroxylase-like FAD-dependent oxidoreductase
MERVGRFSFAAQIAARYRDQRVVLVGDAAHRVTPRGGTGMNTAIHDGFDLAWKLGWVLRGWAAPGLLDSYQTGRRPVGLHNTARSADPDGSRRDVVDGRPVGVWPEAVPDPASAVAARASTAGARRWPSSLSGGRSSPARGRGGPATPGGDQPRTTGAGPIRRPR